MLGLFKKQKAAPWTGMVLVLAAASFLRFFHLGKESLWIDEAYSTWVGSLPVQKIFQELHADPHPPFFYLFLHLWLHGGKSEAYLRFPGVFLGFLSTFFLYLLGKDLFNPRVGLLASLLWAASFFVYDLETQVRWYAYATFFSLAASWLFWKAMQRSGWKQWTVYLVFAATAVYFQYYAGFVILAHTAYLACKKEWRKLGQALAFFLLSALPWLPSFLAQLHGLSEKPPKIGWIDLPNFFSTLMGTYWFVGEHHFLVHVGIALAVLTLLILGFLKLRRVYPGEALFLLLLSAIPLFLPLGITCFDLYHIFFFRYQIVEAAYFFLMIAAFLDLLKTRDFWLALFFSSFLLINLSVWFLSVTETSFERQSWKLASAFLKTRLSLNDIVIVEQPMSVFPLSYYLPGFLSIDWNGKDYVIKAPSSAKPMFYPVSKEIRLSYIQKVEHGAKREWLVLCQDTALDPERKTLKWFLKTHAVAGRFFFPGREPIEIFLFTASERNSPTVQ